MKLITRPYCCTYNCDYDSNVTLTNLQREGRALCRRAEKYGLCPTSTLSRVLSIFRTQRFTIFPSKPVSLFIFGAAGKCAKSLFPPADTFYATHLAYIMVKMQPIEEPENVLVDNFTIVYGSAFLTKDLHDRAT